MGKNVKGPASDIHPVPVSECLLNAVPVVVLAIHTGDQGSVA